jgi:hypothetical protein
MFAGNSGLSKRADIKTYLKKYADGRYRNAVVEFLPDSGLHLIVVPGEINPFSEKAKLMLERRIGKDLGIAVQIAQFSNRTDEVTAAALLQVIEPLMQGNVFDVGVAASSNNGVEVIIFVNDVLIAKHFEEIALDKVREFFKSYDLTVDGCYINELADGVPTLFQIIRLIYTYAPMELVRLDEELKREQIPPPSLNWLKRQLDHLVRENIVVWQRPGNYSPTAAALALLPKRQGASSPDVKRVLALARRKW